jgi:hypothetical protein
MDKYPVILEHVPERREPRLLASPIDSERKIVSRIGKVLRGHQI